MAREQENLSRRERLIEELWQLIQDSKALVAETMRLAAKADEVHRDIEADRHRNEPADRDRT